MGLSRVYIHLMVSSPALVVVLVFILTGSGIADAFADTHAFSPAPPTLLSLQPSSGRKVLTGVYKRTEDDSPIELYLFPTPRSVLAPNHPQNHQSLPPSCSGSSDLKHNRGPTMQLPMGSAVLAECDVLPTFRAAHGILSPEVVSRIADTHDLEPGGPLHKFLKTYKRQGPMACLSLLSDPCVLPALTQAMREVA